MMDVGGWLRSLGLEQYEAAFLKNEIDASLLPNLTAEDLKDLGVSLVGHRRKLLDAIATLGLEAKEARHYRASIAGRPPKADPAERRQVTVMFCDLVGSTALAARMDPEDLREVITTYQKCVSEIVRRYDGFLARYLGDGVLIFFGYPNAHEDDAERAVRVGLEVVDAISALQLGARLQTRVGIATGMVVVGVVLTNSTSSVRRPTLRRACRQSLILTWWPLPRVRGGSLEIYSSCMNSASRS